MLSSLPSALAVVAKVAEGLQVLQVERCPAPIDRDDVVDHLRRSMPAVFQTLLAQRLLLQLDEAQFPPRSGLVELRVGMATSRLRFMFQQPRTADGTFQTKHS